MFDKLFKNRHITLDKVTEEDVFMFLDFLFEKMPQKLNLPDAIDICGTGGSGLSRINTSTISAFVLGSLGVKVAKHGNKAASGRFGSFDLLESLGIPIELDKSQIERVFNDMNLTFIYARKFHPVMKHFAKIRKELGVPTVFNILGPLLNPSNTQKQIIGTAFKDQMHLMAKACVKLRKKKVFIVSGDDGLDEVTITGNTKVVEVRDGKIYDYEISPKHFGIEKCEFSEIEGSNNSYNREKFLEILSGKCKTRHLDLVLVNSALALVLDNKAKNLKEAYQIVKEQVQSGKVMEYFEKFIKESNKINILDEIVANKKNEIEKEKANSLKFPNIKNKSNFLKAICANTHTIIGEIKFSSPTKGKISDFKDIHSIVKSYEALGVGAISVVCDKKYFKGDYKYISEVKKVSKLPILCKEFIIDKYQIEKAKKFGASAVLLIVSQLSDAELLDFLNYAKKLKLDSVVEIDNSEDLDRVLKYPVKIIQINNRNLKTLEIDIGRTQRLIKNIPNNIKIISASGYISQKQIDNLSKKVNAVLIGTNLMNGTFKKYIQLKICGIKSLKEAKECEKIGVQYIGLNFVSKSERRIDLKDAKEISRKLKKVKKIGVFQNQSYKDVNNIARKADLDYVQLSGDENVEYIRKIKRPVIKGISVNSERDVLNAERFIPYVYSIMFDAKNPGEGLNFNHKLIENFKFSYFLAGGLNQNNLNKILKSLNPLVVDVASGVETNGKIDLEKINQLKNVVEEINAK